VFRRLLTRPAFSLAILAYSLVATCAAFYFYRLERMAQGGPELSYLVRPLRTILVRSGYASDLDVFWKNQEVKTDVTTAEIVFWNRGLKAVRGTQIIRPIVIQARDRSALLDVKVQAANETAGFELSREALAVGRATLTWKILEPGDGATLRVTYAGSPAVEIQMDGSVEGQKTIVRLDSQEGTIYRRKFNKSDRTIAEVYEWFVIGGCLCAALMLFLRGIAVKGWWSLLLALMVLMFSVWLMFNVLSEYAEPPFGFESINRYRPIGAVSPMLCQAALPTHEPRS